MNDEDEPYVVMVARKVLLHVKHLHKESLLPRTPQREGNGSPVLFRQYLVKY